MEQDEHADNDVANLYRLSLPQTFTNDVARSLQLASCREVGAGSLRSQDPLVLEETRQRETRVANHLIFLR